MAITYRESICLAQLVVYVPVLAAGLLLSLRHGFAKSSGWFFLITLSILRLIGAISWIIYTNHPSKGAATTAIITTSIGLSPLTLLCMGLLSRVNDFTTKRIDIRIFRYPSLISLVGLCLGITGGIIASTASDPFKSNVYTKLAIAIFTAVFIVVVIILVLLLQRISEVKRGERRLLIVTAMCSPFIAARLVYALVADYANSHSFNATYGNLTIYLCMAVVEEFAVVIMCAAVGFTIPVVQKSATLDTMPLGANTSKYSGKTSSVPAMRQQVKPNSFRPITWLFRILRDSLGRDRTIDGGSEV